MRDTVKPPKTAPSRQAKSGKAPSLRITGGEWRSRVLQAPRDQNITRPTMDQTRQAVFNILQSAAWALQPNGQPRVFNGTVLDGFAGSGAYGFEALSRGAAFATLIDSDKHAVAACQANAETLKCTGRTTVMRGDMLTLAANPREPVTVCFLDPPYADTDWSQILQQVRHRNWIDGETLLVLESSSKTSREFGAAVEGVITVHDQRRYGHALVTFGRLV